MIRNRVEETLNDPGSAISVQLGGASGAGMRTYTQGFGAAVDSFYFIESGAMWECGIGRVALGPPVTFSRNTVLDNSANNTSRLNFIGAARIYNHIPASHAVYKSQLDAVIADVAAKNTNVLAAIATELAARSTGDASLNAFISAESAARVSEVSRLDGRVTAADATRASQDAALSARITTAENNRASEDERYRAATIADDAYWRNVQQQDDVAYANLLRGELNAAPAAKTSTFESGWQNGGNRYDPVWETVFFNVYLPAGVLRINATMHMQIRHVTAGEGGAGENGQIFRCYLRRPDGSWIFQPTGAAVWASVGTYNAHSAPIAFQAAGIPAGSYLAMTSERIIKAGGGTVQVDDFRVGGMYIFS